MQIQPKTPDCAEWFQRGLRCLAVVLPQALGAPWLSQGTSCRPFLPPAVLNPFLCPRAVPVERVGLAELPATAGVQVRRMRLKSRASVPGVRRGARTG